MELIVAIGVFSLFSLLFYSVMNFTDRVKSDEMIHNRLMNDARHAMDKIVWGVGLNGARDGISDATNYLIHADSLDFFLTDGIQRTIELDAAADTITFARQGDEAVIYAPPNNGNEFSTELSFTQLLPQVIQIELILGQRNAGRWYYATLSTEVALRN